MSSVLLPIILHNIPHPSTWPSFPMSTTLHSLIVIYIALCLLLRFHRINTLYGTHPYSNGAFGKPFRLMSIPEAHTITKSMSDLEFPSLFEKGLQMALFRTYGIPSISTLLTQTRQLSSTTTVGKRYADTAILIAEIYANVPGSDRSLDAFSRLNFLHGNYFRRTTTGPRIHEEDMLYTLALFMAQPVEWINRYEWRELSDLEICATGLFHLYMGTSMSIDFSFLPSGAKNGHEGTWKDGWHFYHELDEWAKAYEEKVMVPDQKNYETAKHTRELLFRTYPAFMHGFLGNLMACLMDDRLRLAIIFDPAPLAYRTCIDTFMSVRWFFLRFLALPRVTWFAYAPYVTNEVSPDGRRWLSRYDTLPHYVKPTVWNRWCLQALVSRALGVPIPGDEGMQPEGWRMGAVGPKYFEGKGGSEFETGREKLKAKLEETARTGGCPFFTGR